MSSDSHITKINTFIIMQNEPQEVIEPIEEVNEIVETRDEYDNDTTDWKAKAIETNGIARRNKTKFEKFRNSIKPEAPVQQAEKQVKNEFDYGQMAYLVSKGINESEFPMVLDVMQETGKKLEQVLDAKYFQADLKERREVENSKRAVPEGTRRSSPSTRDSVDYWLAKGELPPADQRDLRQQVVNAKIKRKTDNSIFAEDSVIQ